jgi:selenoprotein W-related protein
LSDNPRTIEALTLVPSGGGVFEVSIDGQLIFSKKQTRRHAEYEEIDAALNEYSARALR